MLRDRFKETFAPKRKKQNPGYENFIQSLAQQIKWLKFGVVERFLAEMNDPDEPIFQKMLALDLINAEALAAQILPGDPDNRYFIKRLVDAGLLAPDWFGSFLRFENGFPLSDPEKGTFAEFLLNQKVVTYDDLPALLRKESEAGIRLEDLVLEYELLDENSVWENLAEFLDVPLVDQKELRMNPETVRKFPEKFTRIFLMMPIVEIGDTIVVTSYRPMPAPTLKVLEDRLQRKIAFKLCTKEQYRLFQEEFNSAKGNIARNYGNRTDEETTVSKGDIDMTKKAIDLDVDSTVEMVAILVQKAVDYRATDIHLEPRRDGLRIRYRVDGILYEAGIVDQQTGREVISRIKILADMDITERRLPQDGHFRFSSGEAQYDMRLATVPTNFGERMEIRLAEGGKVFTSIDQLGFTEDDTDLIDSFISRPHGIVLATGPVGSGKTTTLYSCISKVNRDALNILTIEDPIEYLIEGANQIEVNYKVNFDFVHGLRAILRQDPDVILVGEIRDEETAKIAIRAGMTGMLVFSTLHSNDSVGSVTTLANFQISRFLIANALVGSIAQRLVRKICPHCSAPRKTDKNIRKALKMTAKQLSGYKLKKGVGCEYCFFTGYLGRTGIFELFNVTESARSLIMNNGTEDEMKKKSIEDGLIPLKLAGLRKVKEGKTTVEEYVRVLG